jgi:hypothetical protein
VCGVIAIAGKRTEVAAKLSAEAQRMISESKSADAVRRTGPPPAFEWRLKAQGLRRTNEAEAARKSVGAEVVNEVKQAGPGISAEKKVF